MKHCCNQFKINVEIECEAHLDCWDCPEATIVYSKKNKEFGLPVRDGLECEATSFIKINYCPWCGTEVPVVQRRRSISNR